MAASVWRASRKWCTVMVGGPPAEWEGEALCVESPQPKRVLTETVLNVLATKIEEGQTSSGRARSSAARRSLEGGPYAVETQALQLQFELGPIPAKRHEAAGARRERYHPHHHHRRREHRGDGEPRPQRERWIMLFYLSALAMLSDWICFSAAPIAKFVQSDLGLEDSNLVSCFLATNVAFCLLEPAAVRRFRLRAVVVSGAFAMAAGCALRCLATEIACGSWWPYGVGELPRILVIAGTMLVGAAQPFFQCTPSLLAANWFGENETTFAATVALNANQLGIAGSYAVGAILVHSDLALRRYFGALALVGTLLALGCLAHFRERPLRPPSYSALASLRREAEQLERRRCIESLRRESSILRASLPASSNAAAAAAAKASCSDASDDDDLETADGSSKALDDDDEPRLDVSSASASEDSDDADDPQAGRSAAKRLVRRWLVNYRRVGHGAVDVTRDACAEMRALAAFDGFNACLVAFVSSIVASNIVSTFLPHLVATARRSGERAATIDARVAGLGTGFQVAIMAGSLCFGAAVDATKAYKHATLAAFVGSLAALLAIADDATKSHALELAVLLLGFFVGPIQPVAAELAVDLAYPHGDENTIVAIQQTVGNLVSAAAVPVFRAASVFAADAHLADAYGLRFDYALLAGTTLLAALYFRLAAWHAPLRRSEHNLKSANQPRFAALALRSSAASKYQTM
mmetsp:Transcript_18311/g.57598  ORF Transcript_18311/g.57598 Transcript_18311/m.57598 type:complete len:697 (+) Transcript_18311:100-2190(+)